MTVRLGVLALLGAKPGKGDELGAFPEHRLEHPLGQIRQQPARAHQAHPSAWARFISSPASSSVDSFPARARPGAGSITVAAPGKRACPSPASGTQRSATSPATPC